MNIEIESSGTRRKSSVLALGLAALLLLPLFAPFVPVKSDEPPLEISKKVAAWVISQAEGEGGGYKWRDWSQSFQCYTATYYGVMGVGTFLLAIHHETGNETYLNYAKGAAQWICHVAVAENGGYKWSHPDGERHSPGWWLSPDVAEIGEFLLEMYIETGNQTYLDYAKGAAQWLISMKVKSDAVGYFIPYNPPGKYGSQAAMGIFPSTVSHTAIYLLHMYQQTGNSSYLQIVKETAAWLIGGAESGYLLRHSENGGYKWLGDIPFFVGRSPTTDFPLYQTAWVALFFFETYDILGNETYLENAKGAVRWLLSKATDGCKWGDLADEAPYYLLPWQTNNNRFVDLLVSAYTMTGNSTYIDYAKRYTNWIIDQAVVEGDGYKFPDYEGSATYDLFYNAKVYAYLLMMYKQTSNLTYFAYAAGIKNWLINNAVAGNPGYKWKTQATSPYYNPCWWGSSGIGYYLLEDTVKVIPEFPSSALLFFIAWTFLVAAIAARISKKLKQSLLP